MIATPRTNWKARIQPQTGREMVSADFARKLEIELTETRLLIVGLVHGEAVPPQAIEELRRELAEAKEALSNLRSRTVADLMATCAQNERERDQLAKELAEEKAALGEVTEQFESVCAKQMQTNSRIRAERDQLAKELAEAKEQTRIARDCRHAYETQAKASFAKLAKELAEAKAICTTGNAAALHAITCIHHTDVERAALPIHGNCPICAKAERDQLAEQLKESHAREVTVHQHLTECAEQNARLRDALAANMNWIGAPPTDAHSFDSAREAAWKQGQDATRPPTHRPAHGATG